MKRGMLSLSKDQLSILASYMNHQSTLYPKITGAATEPQSELLIECSEENAEELLDCLPMPSPNEGETITDLRTRIHQFLLQLRT